MKATRKEDGVSITVGISDTGERYISREGKEGSVIRYFAEDEIPLTPRMAPFITAASIWLGPIGNSIRYGVRGDRWNVELVYPNINVIEYKSPSMTLLYPLTNTVTGEESTDLRVIEFDQPGATVKLLHTELGSDNRVYVEIAYVRGGIDIVSDLPVPDVVNIINFLTRQIDEDKTVNELLSTNLISVPKAERQSVRFVRDMYTKTLVELIDDLCRSLNPEELQCEGIVLRDGDNLIKMVDPRFVETNQFYHAVRNCIKRRTFGAQFVQYFPTCPRHLIDEIEELWKSDLTPVLKRQLIEDLCELRFYFMHAQTNGLLAGPNGESCYPDAVADKTYIEFASFIHQLEESL